MIGELFHVILYQPLANGLVFFYNTIAFQDLGLAIVFITLAIRVVFFPLFHKSVKSQAMMQKIQPKLKEVQKKYKDNPQKQAEKMMALYKDHNVSPFSSIVFLLIQLPFLFALYRIFLTGFTRENFAGVLYSFVSTPEVFDHTLFGLINLSEKSILIVGIAAIAQYIQGRLAVSVQKKPKKGEDDKMANMSRKMIYIGPVITLVVFSGLPSAVGLYWVTTSIFSIVQQIIVNKTIHEKEQHEKLETTHSKHDNKDGLRRSSS